MSMKRTKQRSSGSSRSDDDDSNVWAKPAEPEPTWAEVESKPEGSFVAFALSSVLPGVDYDKGMALANRIHSSGQAIVWAGHKEQAELYWEQLKDYGLTMAPLESG